jgi:plasmid stability protein
MTDLRIRDVDDWVLDIHRRQAKKQGSTLENEARQILTTAALAKKQALAQELRAMQEELRQKYGTFIDSTLLIREERERRG